MLPIISRAAEANSNWDPLQLEDLLPCAADESGALALRNIADIANVTNNVSSVLILQALLAASVLHSVIESVSQEKHHELAEAVARRLADWQSTALSLDSIGTVVGLGALS